MQQAVDELEGGFHNISQYFFKEVVSRQAPGIARYLIETSILDFSSALRSVGGFTRVRRARRQKQVQRNS